MKPHFTPTSGSWLNLVESWFSKLTRTRIRRGSFHNLNSLIASIREYVRANNKELRPFRWTKTVDDIFLKVLDCEETLATEH